MKRGTDQQEKGSRHEQARILFGRDDNRRDRGSGTFDRGIHYIGSRANR
jgi:hypothetical protein